MRYTFCGQFSFSIPEISVGDIFAIVNSEIMLACFDRSGQPFAEIGGVMKRYASQEHDVFVEHVRAVRVRGGERLRGGHACVVCVFVSGEKGERGGGAGGTGGRVIEHAA